VSGLELAGLAVTAAMESTSGSVVVGAANAAAARSAFTVEQMTVRSGRRGSNGKRPSNSATPALAEWIMLAAISSMKAAQAIGLIFE
jgi:hypothetical protein